MLYTLTYRPDINLSGASMRLSVVWMAAALMVTQNPQPLITADVTTRAEAICIFFFLLYETINVSTSLFFSISSYDPRTQLKKLSCISRMRVAVYAHLCHEIMIMRSI